VVLRGAGWCSVVQRGAAWCSVVQRGAAWRSVVQRDAMRCSMLHNQVIGRGTICRASSNRQFEIHGFVVHVSARLHPSCKNIEGPTPRICSFGIGTYLVQNDSTRPFWSDGNESANWAE